jgi:hypothetical protein
MQLMKTLIFNIYEEEDITAGIIGGYINRIMIEIEEPEEQDFEKSVEKMLKMYYSDYIVEQVL